MWGRRTKAGHAMQAGELQVELVQQPADIVILVTGRAITVAQLELHRAPDADLIVLDTPPASEAIDFLDAPRRLLELLNSRAIALASTVTRPVSIAGKICT